MSNRTDEQENARIGYLLQVAREAKKVTQEEIAQTANLTKNHISKIERGQSKASVSVLLSYCKKLDMSPDEILRYDNGEEIPEELKRLIMKLSTKQRQQLTDILKITQS